MKDVRDKIREKSSEIIESCEDFYGDDECFLNILDSLDEVYEQPGDAFNSIKEYIIESENYGKCKIQNNGKDYGCFRKV